MYKTTILMGMTMLALSSCEDTRPVYQTDQAKRHDYFMACLAAVPKGPVVTGDENPWHKVIDRCDAAAYFQAQVCVQNCPVLPTKE